MRQFTYAVKLTADKDDGGYVVTCRDLPEGVWVDENWRLTFAFEGKDAVLVDYQDYH